jgi:predicted amidohydrolase YtcJ
MSSADLVIIGTVLTVDDSQPTAEALAVADGRIVAVGERSDVESWIGPNTQVHELGDACVMPGLIEAHGHPLMEAIVLSDSMADIRPVTMRSPDDVVAAVRNEVAKRGASGAYLQGWDPLLQVGLPEVTLAWLDSMAPETPLVILHNSGHLAYFNSASAQGAGVTRDTVDPKGALYGRDANGELNGKAEESGAIFPLLAPVLGDGKEYPAMFLAECARLNKAGLTTCSEMAFTPTFNPVLNGLNDAGLLTVRFRTYEICNDEMKTDMAPVNGDDMLAQVGIKIWFDGSPWIGNIDLSFPYLDTPEVRSMGITPGSCGHANYTAEQLREIVFAYFPLGWPMACHVMGDAGVDTVLDIYEEVLASHPRDDHRLRLEHCSTMRPDQLERAVKLGVTCSFFVDQIHYWGDVLVDGLFGEERGSQWMATGSAVAAGMKISLHNDPPVTPEEPLRNISVATTRTAPSGRVLAPEQRLTVDQAIRAQTIDAAWQLFADDIIGSIEVGKYADLVVLATDPRTIPPEDIQNLEVRATFLAGQQVYGQALVAN